MVSHRETIKTAWHQDLQAMDLPVVDPLKDEGVWAIIDDACNSCCHGEMWRRNAEKKWARIGFQWQWIHKEAKKFNGLGSKKTSGKMEIPLALKLEESGMILPGAVSTHEIPEAEHPMLLSQSCQAQLGITKNMRTGKITLDDYEGQKLLVARQSGTGLFMIRIDHLFMYQYMRHA